MEKHEIKIPYGCEVDTVTTKGGSVVVTFKQKKMSLPKTWEEFCKDNPKKEGECYIADNSYTTEDNIGIRWPKEDRFLLPDRATAEAVLALCQLIQLRDCYNQGWQPDWNDTCKNKYSIVFADGKFGGDYSTMYVPSFLYFKTEGLRDFFLKNFSDLIEKTKPLYGIKEGGEE